MCMWQSQVEIKFYWACHCIQSAIVQYFCCGCVSCVLCRWVRHPSFYKVRALLPSPPLSPLLPPLEFRSSYASTPTWVVTPKGFQYSIFASLNEVSNTQSVWAPPLLCYSASNTETWLKYATELCSIFYHTQNLLLSSPPFQITCQQCGRVSEREEEFLDIPVALSSRTSLEQALNDMYIHTEMLEGPNQYHCENCQRLVDAKRVSTN